MNDPMAKILAKAVLDSVEMRESSYDLLASEAAQEANPERMLDYKQFYKVDLETACIKCSPEGTSKLVYLALNGWWNDTIEWAKEVLSS